MKMLLFQTGYFTLRNVSFPYGKIAVPNEEVAESLIRLSLEVINLKSAPFADIQLLNLDKTDGQRRHCCHFPALSMPSCANLRTLPLLLRKIIRSKCTDQGSGNTRKWPEITLCRSKYSYGNRAGLYCPVRCVRLYFCARVHYNCSCHSAIFQDRVRLFEHLCSQLRNHNGNFTWSACSF